ncbi:hypothetical protein F511_15256 [Dorcoceras hygrometricum]|uniref:Uncharacterized protein n=1 Tax=Dorcoceras hygrometricum TaxID=472368 RepID=A0A2Z7DDK3_9LAMI|nr:hypothetical protein F511_15256 [Dorcoceras hygrometricum]
MRTRPERRPNRKNDRKVLMEEESSKSWADTDSDSSSSSSSSSSDSEQEEVHCLMADQTLDDEVFDFSNIEFTREDLVQALNDMVHEYKSLSHTFEEIKAENASLKNSSAESSSDELEDTDSLKTELSKMRIENELLRTRAFHKIQEIQKSVHDRTGLGFSSSESSEGETSTQSQPAYDKFNKMSFVKANVIHDCVESMIFDDQNSQKLKDNGKAGIGFSKPENSKPSWLKKRLDKDKAKSGQKPFVPNQSWRSSTKVKSGWTKVQRKRDLYGQHMKSKLNRSHCNYAQTLKDTYNGKTVKVVSHRSHSVASHVFRGNSRQSAEGSILAWCGRRSCRQEERTTKGKPVVIAQEAVTIHFVDATTDAPVEQLSVPKRKSQKRKRKLILEDAVEIDEPVPAYVEKPAVVPVVEGTIEDPDTVINQVLNQLDSISGDKDDKQSDRAETWFDRAFDEMLRNDSPVVTPSDTDEEEEAIDVGAAGGDQQVQFSTEGTTDDELLSIEEHQARIPFNASLPSTLAPTITPIRDLVVRGSVVEVLEMLPNRFHRIIRQGINCNSFVDSVVQLDSTEIQEVDVQVHLNGDDIPLEENVNVQTTFPTATADLSPLLDDLKTFLSQRMDNAHSDILSRLHTIERGLKNTLGHQNDYFRNLIQNARQEGQNQDDLQILSLNELKKTVMAQGVTADTDSLEIRNRGKEAAVAALYLLLLTKVKAVVMLSELQRLFHKQTFVGEPRQIRITPPGEAAEEQKFGRETINTIL